MSIEVRGVTKKFGLTTALDDVSLTFEKGCIYGLLGNNGAGKSTLLNIMTGRLFPDSGEVLIDGERAFDNDRVLGRVFMMSEAMLYPMDMRVKKAFRVTQMFYPGFDLDEANQLSAKFGLDTSKKISGLSTGYATIFKLIVALTSGADYLLLDEPVLGLDAQHRDMFYKLLIALYAVRTPTIVLSTHIIQEVANLIAHTVIINSGKVLKDMDNEALLKGLSTISGPSALVEAFVKGRPVLSQSRLGGLTTVSVEGLREGETLPDGLEKSKMDLQSYFIALMNREGGAQ